MNKVFACIDLKSFYASVECAERGLDALTTNLVVADSSRTEKTICLAVSPSLKSYGLKGRSRLYEVVTKVNEYNKEKMLKNHIKNFIKKSFNNEEVKNNKEVALGFIVAPPRMAYYMKYSTNIYNIYLKYISKDDLFSYSIDEVFIDLTNYLKYYGMDAKSLVSLIIQDVYKTTKITATAGIGTNMYLAKIAMDIEAKHMEPNQNGARIAYLDEYSYRKKLWDHTPLTDFWRVGPGIEKKLISNNMYTMGDIARCYFNDEDKLYKLFGVNAEILIDHAFGYEICTVKDAKCYKPENNSISSGQVLHEPYSYDKCIIVLREMLEELTLNLVRKNMVTDTIVLTIGYDVINLLTPSIRREYYGEVTVDHYGRNVPKSAHGTAKIKYKTSSTKIITESVLKLFQKIVNPKLLIRRINIAACNITTSDTTKKMKIEQINLFSDFDDKKYEKELNDEKEEKKIQKTILNIKDKYGKNAIVKGLDLLDGATALDRNREIGGHKA